VEKEVYMPQDQIEKIHQLLGYFDTAMLITHNEQGQPHARPMTLACVDANCDLWFFTGKDSVTAHEIAIDPKALVVCQDEHGRYLSLIGAAQLSSDPEKIHELWDESYSRWFSKGMDDPNLLLICVRTESAEYWDHVGAKGIKYVIEAARAYAHGSQPHFEKTGHHDIVALK
jgi:general stress protein 26